MIIIIILYYHALDSNQNIATLSLIYFKICLLLIIHNKKIRILHTIFQIIGTLVGTYYDIVDYPSRNTISVLTAMHINIWPITSVACLVLYHKLYYGIPSKLWHPTYSATFGWKRIYNIYRYLYTQLHNILLARVDLPHTVLFVSIMHGNSQ